MSNYHITQKQVLEILEKAHVPVEQVELFSSAEYVDIIYLREVINAALDQVLGEPIYLCERPDGIYYELDASEYDPRTDLLLYAPKELP